MPNESMPKEIQGYSQNPQPLVQAAFERVAEQSMHDLSFCIRRWVSMPVHSRCLKTSGLGR